MSIEIQSGDSPEANQYVSKTEAEINDLAKQGYRGELFFSWQLREHDIALLPSVFMVINFLDDVTRKEMIRDKIAHFYGHMKDAAGRSINGYPMFFSMGMLNQEDAQKVHKRILAIMEMLGDYTPEESNGG
jgi:hypothetical protein